MRRKLLLALKWAGGRIPTLLAWAGLAGLFVYGAAHGWKFGEPAEKEKPRGEQSAKTPEPADDDPFTPFYRPQPDGVPVLVTHDPKHCRCCDKPVRFRSPEAAAKAGIKIVPVETDYVRQTVEAHGEVAQDPTAVARVSPRTGGTLFALEKRLGEPVRRGELLALVDSADVGKAKAAYITARAALESRRQILASLQTGVSPPRSIVEAEAAVREAAAGLYAARQGLTNLGLPAPNADETLPDAELASRLRFLGIPFGKRLELYARANDAGTPPSANLLPVFSPLDGVVMRRSGVVGETVAALTPVYDVGDPTRVFVFLDVRQEDMPRVKPGQELAFRLEGGADVPEAAGAIDWISPAMDEKTRTVRVRAAIPNPDGVFRSGAFGAGTITVEPYRPALVVPRESVHWEGCSFIVFVKKSDTEYQPVKVTPGVRQGEFVEVDGVEEGAAVAAAGSHVLKAELLKDRIGAAEE